MQDPQHVESQGGMRDILPAVQKALLLHRNQNPQDGEGLDPTPLSRDKGVPGDTLRIYIGLFIFTI